VLTIHYPTMTRTFILLTALATAASAPLVSRANTLLVFTERSSTLLEATVGGVAFGSVTLNGEDDWFWHPSKDTQGFGMHDSLQWLEPDGTLFFNSLVNSFSSSGIQGVKIQSDRVGLPGGPGVLDFLDGVIVKNAIGVGYTDGTVEDFDVQFFDLSDGSTAQVPDKSATIKLLLLSAIVMLGGTKLQGQRHC